MSLSVRLLVLLFSVLGGVQHIFAEASHASFIQSFLQVKEIQLAGGYSLAAKSEFTKENERLFSASGKSSFPSAALTFWLGRPDLQLGIAAQYMQTYSLPIPAGYAVNSLTITTFSGQLHGRYFLSGGFTPEWVPGWHQPRSSTKAASARLRDFIL